MKGVKHFKSVAGYHRWLAFGHISGTFKVPGYQKIIIKGKEIKVKHKK